MESPHRPTRTVADAEVERLGSLADSWHRTPTHCHRLPPRLPCAVGHIITSAGLSLGSHCLLAPAGLCREPPARSPQEEIDPQPAGH